MPLLDKTRATAHGRDEIRRVKTCTVARGLAFHTQRSRCRSCVGVAPSQPEGSLERIYAVTDLTTDQAGAPEIAQRVRDHWGIENKIHHVRDTTWAKDASRIRTGNAPRTMASLRNLVVGALRLAGHTSVAASLRHHARNTNRPLATLGIMYSTGQIT
ncbi:MULTISPECIES: hypothetical protein [unclassified Streptomyces]|uniref:hypothetical protein n=1 Tax=unclassified Streptomyces TaxID=2593676 RepID=UPI0038112A33